MRELEAKSPGLVGLKYGMIAMGDSSYVDSFCGAGRSLDEVLQGQGAERLGERSRWMPWKPSCPTTLPCLGRRVDRVPATQGGLSMAASPERCSLLVGLLILMVVSVPRYLAGGMIPIWLDGDRWCRRGIVGRLPVVAIVCGVACRAARLMRRLVICLVVGLLVMGIWHALFGAWSGWPLLVSHGATLGLLLHALGLWWKPAPERKK